ncbi:MAG: polysaccharide deacetylase family protein, partial [Syntrophales bacterium LBB04]|nr:polysaccharide deacetylase family protein [Syntrophales bacterium LBB04]
MILLSFDVEEFDIPTEYGQQVSERLQFKVSLQGLERVLELLDRLGIRATFFATAHFALHHEPMIRRMALRHEVASHGYWHGSFEPADLQRSKVVLEKLSGERVDGFRMARMAVINYDLIRRAGYRYNSSENPVFLPGRYNNFLSPRTAYFSGEL